MRTVTVLTVLVLLCLAVPVLQAQPGKAKPAVSYTEPENSVIYDPCTDEQITITGTWHYTVREWNDENGCVHMIFHWNLQNASAIGESGTEYRIQNVLHASDLELKICDEEDCWREETFTQEILLISKGKAGNRRVTYTERGTFNLCNPPTFDLDIKFSKVRVQCTSD